MNKRTVSLSMLVVLTMLVLSACGGMSLNLGANPQTKTVPGANQSAPQQAAPQQPAQQAAQQPAQQTVQQPVASGNSAQLAAYEGTLEGIYTAVSPSVVNIRVVVKPTSQSGTTPSIPGFSFNVPQDQTPQSGLGSGFVWDAQGHIVTNNHVVDGADKIEVTFNDGTTIPATRVGADPDSDLAVIKVDPSAHALQPVQMADSSGVKVGQLAVAIGEPYGLEGTMTAGIISAVGRTLPTGNGAGPSYSIPDVIQTDAPINPGNSGGVLVNDASQVIGVTSAIESPSGTNAGIGFAIPSAIVNNVVPALIKDGHYDHTWLGISGGSLVPELSQAMNLPATQRGVLVAEVVANSPAEKAGLKASSKDATIEGQTVQVGGDVITKINDQPVREIDDLIAYLARSTSVGQTVTLTILRDGKEMSVQVTLTARPTAEQRAQDQTSQNSQSGRSNQPGQGLHLGILSLDMNSDLASAMKLPKDQSGVLVEQVQKNSLAEQMGLKGGDKIVTIQGQDLLIGGDVITAINGQPVSSSLDIRGVLAGLSSGDQLSLTILRNGTEMQLSLSSGG